MALKPKSALHERWKGLRSCAPTVNSVEYTSLPARNADIDIKQHWMPLRFCFSTPFTLKLQHFFPFCFLTRLKPLEGFNLRQNGELWTVSCEVDPPLIRWKSGMNPRRKLHLLILRKCMRQLFLIECRQKLSYVPDSVRLNNQNSQGDETPACCTSAPNTCQGHQKAPQHHPALDECRGPDPNLFWQNKQNVINSTEKPSCDSLDVRKLGTVRDCRFRGLCSLRGLSALPPRLALRCHCKRKPMSQSCNLDPRFTASGN